MNIQGITNNFNVQSVSVVEPKREISEKKDESLNKVIKDFTKDQINIQYKKEIPQEYLEIVKWAESVTGKPVAYKTPEQIKIYLESLKGYPQESYDTKNFLKSLGVENLKTPGRGYKEQLIALKALPNYKPSNTFIQKPFFWMMKNHPDTFDSLSEAINSASEFPAQIRKKWEKPFNTAFKPNPNNPVIPPSQWYKDVNINDINDINLNNITIENVNALFSSDFHFGSDFNYGTLSIAKSLGFTDVQARRIANSDIAIDENSAIYKGTNPSPFGDMDRHFNLNLDDINKKEDTRLIWARRHLNEAIKLAKKGAYIEAEQELGYGLHSLQDMFAHGQLRSTDHATVGKLPDEVSYNPVALKEATIVTAAYLKAYLKAIIN